MTKNSAAADYRPDSGTAYRALEKRLLRSDRQYGAHDWFRWMLEDVLADLTGERKTDPPPEGVIDNLRELSGLYAKCVIEAPPFTDVLGSLYMSMASHGSKKHFGHYFTPAPVAELAAQVQNLATEPRSDGGLWRVLDPAVGSGVMLLAVVRLLHRRDPESLLWWSFTGVDIDRYCALMCACNLATNAFIHQCALGEIVVYRGNSLGPLTKDDLSLVLYGVADPDRAAVREPLVPSAPTETKVASDAPPSDTTSDTTDADTQPGQLQLFFD